MSLSEGDSRPDLIGVAIIERDTDNVVEFTSVYPTLDETTRQVILLKTGLLGKTAPAETIPFRCGQFDGTHFNLCHRIVQETDCLPQVTSFTVVLLTRSFYPAKWKDLCSLLSAQFAATGDATLVLKAFLGALVKGKCSGGGKKFLAAEYDGDSSAAKRLATSGSLKAVVDLFGVESIIIMTAMLLKQRIFVIGPDTEKVLAFTSAIALFAFHRANSSSMVHALHDLNEAECADLSDETHVVAGFVDGRAEDRDDLYDIVANMVDGSIMVADHATATFAMGKVQKELAKTLMEAASADDSSNSAFVTLLTAKIDQICGKIKALGGESGLTREALAATNMPENSQSFLWRFAVAEGLTQTTQAEE